MSTVTLHPAATRVLPGRPHLQLTRRGRVVVFLAATVLVLLVAVFLGAASTATDEAGPDTPTRVVMVGAGDTLWDIAAGLADDGEVREMIAQIKELNALDSGALQVGQELHVPA